MKNYGAVLDEIVRAKPAAAKGRYLKGITTSSTMGPGIKISPEARVEYRTDRCAHAKPNRSPLGAEPQARATVRSSCGTAARDRRGSCAASSTPDCDARRARPGRRRASRRTATLRRATRERDAFGPVLHVHDPIVDLERERARRNRAMGQHDPRRFAAGGDRHRGAVEVRPRARVEQCIEVVEELADRGRQRRAHTWISRR